MSLYPARRTDVLADPAGGSSLPGLLVRRSRCCSKLCVNFEHMENCRYYWLGRSIAAWAKARGGLSDSDWARRPIFRGRSAGLSYEEA